MAKGKDAVHEPLGFLQALGGRQAQHPLDEEVVVGLPVLREGGIRGGEEGDGS
jgi:hypothetical protein